MVSLANFDLVLLRRISSAPIMTYKAESKVGKWQLAHNMSSCGRVFLLILRNWRQSQHLWVRMLGVAQHVKHGL